MAPVWRDIVVDIFKKGKRGWSRLLEGDLAENGLKMVG